MLAEILTPKIESQPTTSTAEISRPPVLPEPSTQLIRRVAERMQFSATGIGAISKGSERFGHHYKSKGRSPRGICSNCHTSYRIREGHQQCNAVKKQESGTIIRSFPSVSLLNKLA